MSPPEQCDVSGPQRAEGSLAEFLHSWRYFFWLLGLGLLIGLLFVEENWRGRWAWNRYKEAMAAQGQPLELSAYAPPAVPDDQNFTMTPLLAPLFGFLPGTSPAGSPLNSIGFFASAYNAASDEVKTTSGPRSNSWLRARTDLPAWHAAFLNAASKTAKQVPVAAATNFTVTEAATGVLTNLSEAEAVFAELQAASKLPACRFNIHYKDEDPMAILLPHLAAMKRLTQVLQLRACAELALGQTQPAFEDTKLLLYLTDACKEEPFLISQLVRIVQWRLTLQPVAEGLGQWSEPQLRDLQARLARLDFCAGTRRALSAERVWSSATIDYLRRTPGNLNNLVGNSSPNQSGPDLGVALMNIVPGGWFDLEKLNCCRAVDESFLPIIDLTGRQVSPRLQRKADDEMARMTERSAAGLLFHHLILSKLLLPGLCRTTQKAAFAQTAADCAVIACALERYRKAQGQYPGSLSELQPEFIQALPHDLINGQSLKYQRAESGGYVLYSVGWNETDEGGAVGITKIEDERSLSQGDWVWRPL